MASIATTHSTMMTMPVELRMVGVFFSGGLVTMELYASNASVSVATLARRAQVRQLFLHRRVVARLHRAGGGAAREVAQLARIAEQLGQGHVGVQLAAALVEGRVQDF